MQLFFLGDVNATPFITAFTELKKELKIPNNLQIYVLQHRNYGYLILKKLPLQARKAFQQALAARTSFSYHYRNKDFLVFYLTSTKKHFMHDKTYIKGLLLHEITHSIHFKKHLYTTIHKSFSTYYLKKLSKIRLATTKKNIMIAVGQQACLLLKDWYVNTELIRKGYAATLIDYYLKDFTHTKTCPQPLFYKKLRKAVQKNPEILLNTFAFEFALFSFLTPLISIHTPKALKLKQHIEQCYNFNLEELERKLQPLLGLYEEHFNTGITFQEKFFTLIFDKALELLL
ncbi:MAG: hypothetical protein Q7R96_01245 [Nanoarchaeota archaeon]|nr:hypothetical protein [Nanoarchaeota archaeon]